MASNDDQSPGERSPRLGMELGEITPIILGGDPEDPKNKIWLTRTEHIQMVRYWNKLIRELKKDLARS